MLKRFQFAAFLFLTFSISASAQNDGDSLFNSGQLIHEIRITFPGNNWYDSLTHYVSLSTQLDSNIYLMGTVLVDGVGYDSVAFKFKGNSSYNNNSQKKSWKLSFEEFKKDNEIYGLNELNLNNGFKDPTLLREKICLDFYRHYGLPAPRADYANVYVNNQLWGLYILVEEVDKKFLKTHFDNKGGNLFKGDPAGNLTWKGLNPAMYYNNYELETNTNANDWTDLVWMIDNLNNSTSTEFHDSLAGCFNVSAYVKQWGATNIFANLDSYTGSGHNYYIYHNVDSNRFEWIAWDVNEAFGVFTLQNTFNATSIKNMPIDFIPATPPNSRPLHTKIMGDSIYWNEYKNFLCNAVNDYFTVANMGYIIDSLHDRIQGDAYADPRKFYNNTDFETNITTDIGNTPGLKSFVQVRHDYLLQQLANFICTQLPNGVEDITSGAPLQLYPNPVDDMLSIALTGYRNSATVMVYDLSGKLVLQNPLSANFTQIDVSPLTPGIYLLKVDNAVRKFVKL